MEEKYYGVLMHRVVLDDGLYVFKPKTLLEGTLVEEAEDTVCFMDNQECEYNLATDSYGLDTDEDMVVGYPISESELLKLYPDFSLEEAKSMYIGNIFEHIHLGCLMYETQEIKITPTNLQDYVIKMNGLANSDDIVEAEFEITDDLEDYDMESNEVEAKECIFMSMDYFKEIMQIDDYEKLKLTLQKVYDAAVETTEEMSEELSLDDTYNRIYDSLLKMNNLTLLKKTVSKIKHIYMDELLKDKKETEEVNDELKEVHSICDPYLMMVKTDDLDALKKELKLVRKQTLRKLKKLDPEVQAVILEKLNEVTLEPEVKFDVQSIKKHFDERIIGQEEAKRDVISAIYMNKLVDDPSNKNNCLLVGPTGSGKTLLAETVAEYFDMPIEIIDTTQLTVPGYVGANLEDFLERLLAKTKGDVKAAEEGIVVFDEIDKKGSESNGDISGKGVLNTLLPFIGGTTYDIKYNGRTVHFNTSRLTIFATGAFTNAVLEKDNVYNGSRIGFGGDISKKDKEDIVYPKLETDDFIKKGNVPAELIGRFSIITQLSGHNLESLKNILTESDRSALLSEQAKLANIGINLTWTEGYLEAVANEALKLKTGARSLKSTVDKSVKEVRWEVINHLEKYKGIILTEETVNDNLDCLLVYRNNKTKKLKDIIGKEKAKVKVKE